MKRAGKSAMIWAKREVSAMPDLVKREAERITAGSWKTARRL